MTVQFVSGDDKQPMDKSSRYTIFGHVAEIRDAIPCDLHVERRSERKAIGLSSAPSPPPPDYQLREGGNVGQARSGGPRDSCKRCNTCRTRKPFIAVLSLRARKSRFVTPMIAPALYATPATPPSNPLMPGIISIVARITWRAL